MRVPIVPSLLVLVACGGSPKPAASDPSDTSSLESSESSSTTSSAPASSAASTGTDAPAPTIPSAATSTPPDSTAPSASASVHPVPGATGSIDGKPFSPKLAQVAGPLQKDGRLLVVLHEGSDCVTSADAKPGDASMMLLVPWKDGYKVDLASLLRSKRKKMGEATFVRVGADGKNQVSTTFKPTGLLTVVSAPTQKDAIGKLKIDLQNGDYILAGDMDVKVCAAPQ
jgi:hypothetical protein